MSNEIKFLSVGEIPSSKKSPGRPRLAFYETLFDGIRTHGGAQLPLSTWSNELSARNSLRLNAKRRGLRVSVTIQDDSVYVRLVD